MFTLRIRRTFVLLCALSLALPAPALAQQAQKFELTVDSIMRGPDLVGYEPTRDQKSVYFTRNNNLFVLALDGASLKQLTDIRTGGAQSAPGPLAQGGFGGRQRGAESADGTLPEAVATGLAAEDDQQGEAKPP